jgi:hypothetical protein
MGEVSLVDTTVEAINHGSLANLGISERPATLNMRCNLWEPNFYQETNRSMEPGQSR